MLWHSKHNDKLEQEAEKLIKQEAAENGQTKTRLRRWASKRDLNESRTIAKVLSKYLESPQDQSESLAYTLISRLKASTTNSEELTKYMDDLLNTSLKCKRLHLFSALTWQCSSKAVSSALSEAVHSGDRETIDRLLLLNVNAEFLDQTTILNLIKLDPSTFRQIQSKTRFNIGQLQNLCEEAIRIGDTAILCTILKELTDVNTKLWKTGCELSRDKLIIAALEAGRHDLLKDLASYTPSEPLWDSAVLRAAIDGSSSDNCGNLHAFESLFEYFEAPESFSDPTHLEYIFKYSIDKNLDTILILMIREGVRVPAATMREVCQRSCVELLDHILLGSFEISDDIWSYCDCVTTTTADAIRDRLLIYMFARDIAIPCKDEVLRQSLAANQSHLVGRLIAVGASIGGDAEEVLSTAVSSCNYEIVQAILPCMHFTAIEACLRATEQLDRRNRFQMTKILLGANSRPGADAVNYLILKMLCDCSTEVDKKTLDLLLAYSRCVSGGEAEAASQFPVATTLACLHDKRQMRSLIENQIRSSTGGEQQIENMSLQTLLPSNQNIHTGLSDDICSSQLTGSSMHGKNTRPDALPFRLLTKYIMECNRYIADTRPWPRSLINLLLVHMTNGLSDNPDLYLCMQMAVRCQQPQVFRIILAKASYLERGFQMLPYDQMSINTEYVDAVFESLLSMGVDENSYSKVVTAWFHSACKNHHFTYAGYISTNSRQKLQVGSSIQYIMDGLTGDANIASIRSILQTTITTQAELEQLWIRIVEARTSSLVHQIRIILEAGFTGDSVSSTICKEVVSGRDDEVVVAILEGWQVPKSERLRPCFDYQDLEMKPTASVLPENQTDRRYYYALAEALSRVIQAQLPDRCRLLLNRGAPLVFENKSLIAQAIQCGGPVSLKDDAVLRALFHSSTFLPDFQAMLNYALLEAIKYQRHLLVTNLVQMGADTCAYNDACWLKATQVDGNEVLEALLSCDTARKELSASFHRMFASLSSSTQTIDLHYSMMLRLHAAGFKNQEFFSRVLVLLSAEGSLNPHRIGTLLQCGASVEHQDGKCIRLALEFGEVGDFEALLQNCKDESLVQSIFISLFKQIADTGARYPFRSPRLATTREALRVILCRRIDQYHLNNALATVARTRVHDQYSICALSLLLTKGARFGEEATFEALAIILAINNETLTKLAIDSDPPMAVRRATLLYMLDPRLVFVRPYTPNLPHHPYLHPGLHFNMKISHSVLLDVLSSTFFCKDFIPASRVDAFFSCVQVDSTVERCEQDCSGILETLLTVSIEEVKNNIDLKYYHVDIVLAVLRWLRLQERNWTCSPTTSPPRLYSLNWALNDLLLAASKKGDVATVIDLLNFNTDPDVVDTAGHTPLFLAVDKGSYEAAEALIAAAARPNDGSLHLAVCRQNERMMQLLLGAAHSPVYASEHFEGEKVLRAFVDHLQRDQSRLTCTATIFNLLMWMYENMGVDALMEEVMSVIDTVMDNRHAYDLLEAILTVFESCEEAAWRLRDTEFPQDRFIMSAVTWMERRPSEFLDLLERDRLIIRLLELDIRPLFYAAEGAQPADAINVPPDLFRQQAFASKSCAVCTDKPASASELHADLTPDCAPNHGWTDEVICSDCLQTYLNTKMFPHNDEHVRYKFPESSVPCWAPKCQSTLIPHNVLQELVPTSLFALYDNALCQLALSSATSMVKCATPDCAGAIWVDEGDIDDEENDEATKIFFCLICFTNTCIECNDFYDKHDGRPCPAGSEAKTARVKEEEKLSEEALKKEKRCPKCNLLYEKMSGCDHIVCGKNMYNTVVDKGCRHEFCNICFGDWPDGHTATCTMRGY